MVSTITFATIAAAAVLSGTAQAHQTVYIPAPTFTTNDKVTKTNPIAFLENQGVKTSDDLAGFLKKYKSLREYLDNTSNYKTDAAGASFECGYTNAKGARQPVPANGMMRSSGYIHEGPCEVWIDDTKVLGGTQGNCQKDFPGQPVSYKVDFSSCKGDCLIRWYWLGKRLLGKKYSWQVYKECIPIRGGGAARSMDEAEETDEYRTYDNSTAAVEESSVVEEPAAVAADDVDARSFHMYENDEPEAESYRMDGFNDEEGEVPEEETTEEETPEDE